MVRPLINLIGKPPAKAWIWLTSSSKTAGAMVVQTTSAALLLSGSIGEDLALGLQVTFGMLLASLLVLAALEHLADALPAATRRRFTPDSVRFLLSAATVPPLCMITASMGLFALLLLVGTAMEICDDPTVGSTLKDRLAERRRSGAGAAA